MAKRGSNSVTMPLNRDQHISVGVRKIANGFVVSHSQNGPKGEYQSTEHFHAKAPKISVSGVAPPKGIKPPATPKGMKSAAAPKATSLAAKLEGVKL